MRAHRVGSECSCTEILKDVLDFDLSLKRPKLFSFGIASPTRAVNRGRSAL